MLYDFITIGGATRDISLFSNQGIVMDNKKDILRQKLLAFEYGAKIRVDKFHYTYGGGGTNTAVNLANFGLKTACITAVSSDENGRAVIANLKRLKADTKLIKRFKEGDTGFSFILISKGERVIFTERGVNSLLKIETKDLKALKNTKQIYISSLSGKWLDTLSQIFSVVKGGNIKVSWNPSEAQYRAGLKKLSPFLKHTYVFAVNKDEATELALMLGRNKFSRKFLDKEKNLLDIIYAYGPKIVMITSGNQGAYVYDGKKYYHQAILKEKKKVDMTGVGDVFNSSFVAGLSIFKEDIPKSLKLAARNTASKIAHLGAQNGLIPWNKTKNK